MTLWSGRFDSTPDPDAFDFGVSFGFDRALFEDDVTGSLAWAEALAAAGVLSGADAEAIRRGLQEILEAGRRDPAFVDGPDEDVHSFVERKLVRATSRSHSICGSTSGVVSRSCSRGWRGWLPHAPIRQPPRAPR
jgi:argininosuccinate lyase